MGGWSNSDARNLERLADAAERTAEAEERRNDLIAAEAVERRESWARTEERNREAIRAILTPQPVATDEP